LLAAGEDPAAHQEELARYARSAGVSGQMRDDYLDLFGDAGLIGKPAGSDLRSGRRSYTVCAVLAATSGAERELVESALAGPGCPPETVARIQDIARHHGVDEQVRADIRRGAEEASAVAKGWRGRWRDDAVEFFERLPLWGARRAL
ncbi:polyprenyl synthetase family protein, partial [Streptomyces sp. t39]|uniref:polyprenyl synthetase family protein n=1 Tax=Streptomyces sp. t39 TaxID=1828156 RepID=UPI0011CDA39E